MRVAPAISLSIVVGVGCDRLVADQEQDLGAAERQIVGLADPYPADASLRGQEEALRASMSARRKLAWDVVARFVEPVGLNPAEIELLEAEQLDAPLAIPRFLTWYQKDELKRMFRQLYQSHGAANRAAKAPLSPELLDGIFEFNANYLAEKGMPEQIFTNRVKALEAAADLAGLAGAEAISYSPALFTHLFRSYARIHDCLKPLQPGSSASLLDGIDPSTPPHSEDDFTFCFDGEMPIDAAIAKAFWSNDLAFPQLPVFDTSAAALSARLSGGDGGWGITGDAKANPGAESILTLRLVDGTTYRMPALHIVTKELRHWLWITLWYSPEPDADFGADRPSSMAAIDPIWSNYKMCVVTSFDEGDADPRGGYPTSDDASADPRLVSLGDALEATHRGAGGPTWCSNPYLEEGPLNARSNCIGCHQHAGTALDPSSILSDDATYPHHGTTLVRANHPADYVWAFDKATRLGRVIESEIVAQDQKDAAP